ncbi:MAG: C1 family peptidase [Rhodospirillaceae bacterium]
MTARRGENGTAARLPWPVGRAALLVALAALAMAGPAAVRAEVQTAEITYGTGDADPAAAEAVPRHGRSFQRGLKFKPAEVYRGFERTSGTRGLMLPPAADLSALFPPPKDQGDQSSCVAWSVSYAMRGYYANRALGRSGDHDPVLLSPSFVYNQIADPAEGCDGGSDIADALKLLRDLGTVPMTRFPYRETDCSRRPPADLKREAGAWRIQSWKTVDLANPAAIKEQIAKGDPVVIGMYVNDAFSELTGAAVFRDTGRDGGGHAMVVVGYDDRKRAFRLINSWGREWGENGFGWVSYDSFKARTDEAYVATVAGLPPLPDPQAPPVVSEPPPRPAPTPRLEPDPAPAPDPVPAPDPAPEPEPASKVDTRSDTAPPGLSPRGQKAFEDYRAARPHKAFALAPDGSYGWRSGRIDDATAGEEAIAACDRHTTQGCRVVDVDDRPVAKRPTGPIEIPAISETSDDEEDDVDE